MFHGDGSVYLISSNTKCAFACGGNLAVFLFCWLSRTQRDDIHQVDIFNSL
jgi:hypothetical protein